MSKYVMMSSNSKDNIKEAASTAAVEEQRQLVAPLRVWVPHPPTGIYYPQGQERVMEGIPNEAASFDQTFWLRNTDGVDKPDPTYP
ncbi:glutamate racemase [Perilla frutescens var. frutescens]|nr:glutamate racemase [Perilla frutescens var. frutescens]